MPEDLSFEERDELSNIRRRKKELLDDIEVSALMQPLPFRIIVRQYTACILRILRQIINTLNFSSVI